MKSSIGERSWTPPASLKCPLSPRGLSLLRKPHGTPEHVESFGQPHSHLAGQQEMRKSWLLSAPLLKVNNF